MSEVLNPKRKERSESFTITDDSHDLPSAKRVKESSVSDTASEVSSGEDDRLNKMSQAIKTLIEVNHYMLHFYNMIVFNFLHFSLYFSSVHG